MSRRHSRPQEPEVKAIPLTEDKSRDDRLLVAALVAAGAAVVLTLVAQFALG
ncbi:hypothetical protein [Halomonas sp. WWR20]